MKTNFIPSYKENKKPVVSAGKGRLSQLSGYAQQEFITLKQKAR